MEALSPAFRLATAGAISGAPDLAIDHPAVSDALEPVVIVFLCRRDAAGVKMSDQFGLRVFLQ